MMSERILPTSIKQAGNDENSERDRIVALKDRGVSEIAHTIDVEDLFDQK